MHMLRSGEQDADRLEAIRDGVGVRYLISLAVGVGRVEIVTAGGEADFHRGLRSSCAGEGERLVEGPGRDDLHPVAGSETQLVDAAEGFPRLVAGEAGVGVVALGRVDVVGGATKGWHAIFIRWVEVGRGGVQGDTECEEENPYHG